MAALHCILLLVLSFQSLIYIYMANVLCYLLTPPQSWPSILLFITFCPCIRIMTISAFTHSQFLEYLARGRTLSCSFSPSFHFFSLNIVLRNFFSRTPNSFCFAVSRIHTSLLNITLSLINGVLNLFFFGSIKCNLLCKH